mmetsp:Transcript_36064/g.78958  ORF Transcript_36064/g.78958 Transcript_36064/m.78958 type:complete len:114 (-) Transcript_36064:543-884(-)
MGETESTKLRSSDLYALFWTGRSLSKLSSTVRPSPNSPDRSAMVVATDVAFLEEALVVGRTYSDSPVRVVKGSADAFSVGDSIVSVAAAAAVVEDRNALRSPAADGPIELLLL